MKRPRATCSFRRGAPILNRPHWEKLWHAGCLVKWSHCAHKNRVAYERSRPQTLPSSVHQSPPPRFPRSPLPNVLSEPTASPSAPRPPPPAWPVGLVGGSPAVTLIGCVAAAGQSLRCPSTEQASLVPKNAVTTGEPVPSTSALHSHTEQHETPLRNHALLLRAARNTHDPQNACFHSGDDPTGGLGGSRRHF